MRAPVSRRCASSTRMARPSSTGRRRASPRAARQFLPSKETSTAPRHLVAGGPAVPTTRMCMAGELRLRIEPIWPSRISLEKPGNRPRSARKRLKAKCAVRGRTKNSPAVSARIPNAMNRERWPRRGANRSSPPRATTRRARVDRRISALASVATSSSRKAARKRKNVRLAETSAAATNSRNATITTSTYPRRILPPRTPQTASSPASPIPVHSSVAESKYARACQSQVATERQTEQRNLQEPVRQSRCGKGSTRHLPTVYQSSARSDGKGEQSLTGHPS